MAKYGNIKEEELKNKVAHDYFATFDSTQIIGNIDFCIAPPREGAELFEPESLLWAEAKRGTKKDIYASFVQLILTIGRARTFDRFLPPAFLGSFDAEKIAFLPYYDIIDVFSQNDFNWNVTPSDHDTREFRQLYDKVKDGIERQMLLFRFGDDDNELRGFIRRNFVVGKAQLSKVRINKNNFTHIYQKWLKEVKPSIAIEWDIAKKEGLIDADFYLADILSEHNVSLRDKLFVLLRSDRYVYNIQRKATGSMSFETVEFNDRQAAHARFWNRYDRPPKREYWDYIVERRDLLVPQDVRERKGSYFTPQRWVELSQQYLADELGDNWQDEYYVWDCAAGTGNLLAGLTNKYNIWASTLDPQDVKVMKELISTKSLNLLDGHVFQFDFLNDPFTALPQPLQDIINDPEKRRKLVVYINPPYAEADNRRGTGRQGVAVSKIHKEYAKQMGYAKREVYIQFLTRIYHEIPSSVLADFSKLKNLQAPKFRDFRQNFRAKLGRLFLVPAKTFDNVKGEFPISFQIWNTSTVTAFEGITADVYNEKAMYIGKKKIFSYDHLRTINDWTLTFIDKTNEKKLSIATIIGVGNDFQNQRLVRIEKPNRPWNHQYQWQITKYNLIQSAIYLTVRTIIEPTWLNDRDQFIFPNEYWVNDKIFQSNCLAYTLFNNNIQSADGVNHWIPFTEEEVNAKEKFKSHFMSDYIKGKVAFEDDNIVNNTDNGPQVEEDMFAAEHMTERNTGNNSEPLTFSPEAQAVMDAGRELWRYYHAQPGADPDAAFYDIRLHFQGTNMRGKMNADSDDERYTALITTLRQRLKQLAHKIEPKVYEYGFLLR